MGNLKYLVIYQLGYFKLSIAFPLKNDFIKINNENGISINCPFEMQ